MKKTGFLICALAVILLACQKENQNSSIQFENSKDHVKVENIKSQSFSTRKIIKEGELIFEMENPENHKKALQELFIKYNVIIISENETTEGNKISVQQSLDIPENEFENFIKEIEKWDVVINNKSIWSTDVTEEYIDINSRLITKKKVEQNFIQLMNKAQTVSEMLEIERELERIRMDIEVMEGRLNYINHNITYSNLLIFYTYQQDKKEFKSFLIISISVALLLLLIIVRAFKKKKKSG